MAKINYFIAEFQDVIREQGISEVGLPPKKVIRKFLRIFRKIDDIRLQGMIAYPLEEIVLIAFLAILGNASTWAEIAAFGVSKKRWLKKFLKLDNGIPSHDTFRRVFSLIDTEQLQQVTVTFLMENLAAIKNTLGIKDDGYRQICIDGKEQKGTGRKYNTVEKIRNLQTLHVYDATNEICLYSKAINEKTNEIPVAQEIIQYMNLKGCIVSFDALHTQKDTINAIVDKKGDYIGGLKGNQGNLLEEAEDTFTGDVKKHLKDTEFYYETIEKAHGQIEKRRFYLSKVYPKHTCAKGWKKLKNFVCYEKYTCNCIDNAEKTETRYYITSLDDITVCADAIRGHWGIENKLHWHLDYSLCEDMNTTMDKTAFNNYSLLNKMVLSLCKIAKPFLKNASIRIIRKMFGWDYEQTLSILLTVFDEDTLKKVLENTK